MNKTLIADRIFNTGHASIKFLCKFPSLSRPILIGNIRHLFWNNNIRESWFTRPCFWKAYALSVSQTQKLANMFLVTGLINLCYLWVLMYLSIYLPIIVIPNRLQLWPENPTYQVYVPGYNPNLLRSTTASIQQQQQQLHRAGSVSPNTINALMTTDNRVLYAELQFPVTSNYGSMKKRSQRDSVANTTASTRCAKL